MLKSGTDDNFYPNLKVAKHKDVFCDLWKPQVYHRLYYGFLDIRKSISWTASSQYLNIIDYKYLKGKNIREINNHLV